MAGDFRTVVKGTTTTHDGGEYAKDVGWLGLTEEEAEKSADRANRAAKDMGLGTRYEPAPLK